MIRSLLFAALLGVVSVQATNDTNETSTTTSTTTPNGSPERTATGNVKFTSTGLGACSTTAIAGLTTAQGEAIQDFIVNGLTNATQALTANQQFSGARANVKLNNIACGSWSVDYVLINVDTNEITGIVSIGSTALATAFGQQTPPAALGTVSNIAATQAVNQPAGAVYTTSGTCTITEHAGTDTFCTGTVAGTSTAAINTCVEPVASSNRRIQVTGYQSNGQTRFVPGTTACDGTIVQELSSCFSLNARYYKVACTATSSNPSTSNAISAGLSALVGIAALLMM